MAEEVLAEVLGKVLVLTINRADQRNAVNLAVTEGIAAGLERLDDDEDLAVGVLTGAGGTFCAGMDLKAFLQGERPVMPGRGFAGLVRQPPRKPLIAAVEGFALAGGFEIALACDLIVAAESATFGVPEVKRGLTAAGGALFRLPRQIPWHIAMEYILTGERMSAHRAAELGLVNRLVPEGEAVHEAVALANLIAGNGPLAVAVSKEVVLASLDWSMAEAFEAQEPIVDPVRRSEDAREGAQAFAEKRDPVWKGR